MEDVDFLKSQTSSLKKQSDINQMKQVENESNPEPSAPPKEQDSSVQVRSRSKAKKEL